MALESALNRKKALLDLHIHTFGCLTCPSEVKNEACISNGKYCSFYPKVGNYFDSEDLKDAPKDLRVSTTDFSGRELIESSIYEKCYHNEIRNLIEAGGEDTYDLEKSFIERMVQRVKTCEDLFAQ